MNLSVSSSLKELVRAVTNVITEKNTVAQMSTGRRPILSATMLNSKAPSNTPNNPAPNTGPSCALEMFQS